MTFTWIPFFNELSKQLLQFRDNRTPLVNWIYDNLQGYIGHLKDAPDGKRVPDVDPFTVLAIINRGISFDKKVAVCAKLKDYLQLSESIPQDFNGVPEMNSQRSNFFGFEADRKEGDIERLWQVFEDAVDDKDISKSYDALNGQFLIKFNITIGLFWIRPDKYLPLDTRSQELLKGMGITLGRVSFLPYKDYENVMRQLNKKMQAESLGFSNYAEMSFYAYQQKDDTRSQAPQEVAYWTYSPGRNASKWDECVKDGIMCIGWDELGDLTRYSTRDEMTLEIKKQYSTDGSAKNSSLAVWQFATEMKPGDIVFAKRGRKQIIGQGVVESGYSFDASRSEHKHVRRVKWIHVGEWATDEASSMKTLTNVSRYSDYVNKLLNLTAPKATPSVAATPDQQYWWLTGSPSYWSPSRDWEIGEDIDYTLYNEKGNKRRVFKHFYEAKAGDPVIAYESTPVLQIVALGQVVEETDGEVLYVKKIEDLAHPVPYSEILANPLLQKSEPVMNRCQGSLFSLTQAEYDEIMRMIREANSVKSEHESYDAEKFLDQVFVNLNDYKHLTHLLLRKKNLILQGAPGVGKTFAAKRLAYAMMGEKDDSRVTQVQFHQNYSYEDFVMGYKPNAAGGFELRQGVFYQFCKKAEADAERKYFFIIDEINRGNLSKIFGELLMLIEKGYRGKEIQLAYTHEAFSVPDNVYIIGMMNTADRSLAMIDYALRRRFSFFEMKPGFEHPCFMEQVKRLLDPKLEKLVKAIIELNSVIEDDDSLGSGFCIGHSYLCDLGVDYDLQDIVEYDIIPMLREYWFDNNSKFEQQAQRLRDAIK